MTVSIALNAFTQAANDPFQADRCLRVDGGGVHAIGSLRSLFTLGSTHRRTIGQFLDALKATYGSDIANMVALRQGLKAGAGELLPRVRRITGSLVKEAVAEAAQARLALLETFKRGEMPAEMRAEAPEELVQAGNFDPGAPPGERTLVSAIRQWSDTAHLGLDAAAEETVAAAVYAELAGNASDCNSVQAMFRTVAEGKCAVQQALRAALPKLRERVAGQDSADAAFLVAAGIQRLCQNRELSGFQGLMQEIQESLDADLGEDLDEAKRQRRHENMQLARAGRDQVIQTEVDQVNQAWHDLSEANLFAALPEEERASLQQALAQDAPALRRAVMQGWLRQADNPPWMPMENQRWMETLAARMSEPSAVSQSAAQAAMREVLTGWSHPSPLEAFCEQRPFSAGHAQWTLNVQAAKAALKAQLPADDPAWNNGLAEALLTRIAADPDLADLLADAPEQLAAWVQDQREAMLAEVEAAKMRLQEAGYDFPEAVADALLRECFVSEAGVTRFVALTEERIDLARQKLEALRAEIANVPDIVAESAEGRPSLAEQYGITADDASGIMAELIRRCGTPEYALTEQANPKVQVAASLAEVLAELVARRQQVAAAGLGPKTTAWLTQNVWREADGEAFLIGAAELAAHLLTYTASPLRFQMESEFAGILYSTLSRHDLRADHMPSDLLKRAWIRAAMDALQDDGALPSQDKASQTLRTACAEWSVGMQQVVHGKNLSPLLQQALCFRLQNDLPLLSPDAVKALCESDAQATAIAHESLQGFMATPDKAHWRHFTLAAECCIHSASAAEAFFRSFLETKELAPEARRALAASLQQGGGAGESANGGTALDAFYAVLTEGEATDRGTGDQ